ncbi:multiple epidermal growth factor-like domains protein 10 isoform X2 [Ostrea edulis]|uniref:multiple epidermal growth factor-like domains protein 10 isoform X2 n=1 Tax=Ostrea edulis TaxID=37623 RepID=UPI0024AFA51B|nr:multiple epidermal growth factor-like domains protein 10 isoform X2 [Ostrea edulis]
MLRDSIRSCHVWGTDQRFGSQIAERPSLHTRSQSRGHSKCSSLAAVVYSVTRSEKTMLCSDSNKTCCTDFKLVNGVCERCIGSWGLNCNRTCPDGFYGFGCRLRCACENNQTCHSKIGCNQNYTESMRSRSLPIFGIAAGASGVIGCLCLLITCCVLWKRKTNNKDRRTAVNTNDDVVNYDETESRYSSIRGSIISQDSHIDHVSYDDLCSSSYDVISRTGNMMSRSDIAESDATPKYVAMASIPGKGIISNPSDNEAYVKCSHRRNFFPASQSVRVYEKCRESVDEYDHLDSKRACTLPPTATPRFPLEVEEFKIFTKETILAHSSGMCTIYDKVNSNRSNRHRPQPKLTRHDDRRPYSTLKHDRIV